MATVSVYKTYRFMDKDPVVDQLRTIFEDEHASYEKVSADSGISATTFYNWFHGKTKRPQHATVVACLRALGYDYKIVKGGRIVPMPKAGRAAKKTVQKRA